MAGSQRAVSVLNFCRLRYSKAMQVQKHYQKRHLDALAGVKHEHLPAKDILLYGDHKPVYTVGNRPGAYSQSEEERLRALGADFERTDRGGLITFHGPGQLIVYPILNLKNYNIGMREYICRLQKAVIKTCRFYGVDATTTSDTGVWIENRKICAMGVHGRRHITTHGIALNCNNNLTWFKHIVPCGLEGKEVTSLSKEVGEFITNEEAMHQFLQAFMEEFDCTIMKNRETHPELDFGIKKQPPDMQKAEMCTKV